MRDEIIVKCTVDFDFDGKVTPISITWPNGRSLRIQNILESRPFETLTGKAGIVYTCKADGQEIILYYDHRLNNWYLNHE